MRFITSYTVVPARGTPRRSRRGDPVAGTHNHRLWNMGPQHKRVYARLPTRYARGRRRDLFSIMWRASILTIFPEMFPGPLGLSLAGKALAAGLWTLEAVDIRAHATDKHRSVDDTPAGGGPGMVMRPDVLAHAVDATAPAGDVRPRLVMSARGVPLTQSRVAALASGPGAVILCGRFEGVDERLIEGRSFEEVSIGDYVLSGGEIAAFALLDACVRLLPGVMGKEASGLEESFSQGLLEYPQYTRPQVWEGRSIPAVLTGGDHAKVAAWRRAEAERLTRARRPDLWAALLGGAGKPKRRSKRPGEKPRRDG
jgi:tRNA (guanine37-N1)-methyltransferase